MMMMDAAASILLGRGLLTLLSRLFSQFDLVNKPFFHCLVYAVLGFCCVYAGKPKRVRTKAERTDEEFLITSDGQSTEVFRPGEHPEYQRIFQSANGCSYTDDCGQLIHTTYGTRTIPPQEGKSRIHLLLICAVTVLTALALEEVLACGNLDPVKAHMLEKLQGLWERIPSLILQIPAEIEVMVMTIVEKIRELLPFPGAM